jgi:3D (Asp-Asp-Asp) domain-containing protein
MHTKISSGARAALMAVLMAVLGIGCQRAQRTSEQIAAVPTEKPTPQRLAFSATAYSIEGETASGKRAQQGIVAADPRVLAIGTRIRVHDAGAYSGEYVVADTGRAIKGRELDIYLRDGAEAKRFGRRKVAVEVLSDPR